MLGWSSHRKRCVFEIIKKNSENRERVLIPQPKENKRHSCQRVDGFATVRGIRFGETRVHKFWQPPLPNKIRGK
jgi:hypothetical protein